MIGWSVRMMKPILILAAVLLSAVLVACGGGDSEKPNAGATTPAGGGPASFDVSIKDNFFEPKEFTVSAGAKVSFKLKNDGIAIHSMRVAGADNQFNTADDAVSKDALINAGQSSSLEWTAPTKPGTYNFQCDFHTPAQVGTITVT